MLDYEVYRKKLSGCFVGKSVGGTLGMPYEGDLNINHVSYYDPVPSEMVPNDDLDLQVVHLENVIRYGLPINRFHLGSIWKHHIADSTPDEYGVAKSNYDNLVFAPLSGIYNNKFYSGMGGAIRSELWACLAPGNPDLVASFAIEDSCSDHTLDGIYAEMFLSAIESAAFVESDINKLIDIGLKYIPSDSRLSKGLKDVLRFWDGDALSARQKVLDKYYTQNWTDVTINLCFILISLLASNGDFDIAICTAASLGYDADCTCATVGAILGIINPDGIDKKWTAPIGDSLVLSNCITNTHEGPDIGGFCQNIASVCLNVLKYYDSPVKIVNVPHDFNFIKMASPWTNKPETLKFEVYSLESMISTSPLILSLCYPENIAIIPHTENEFKLKIMNPTDIKIDGTMQVLLPENWLVSQNNFKFSIEGNEIKELRFTISTGELKRRCGKNILTFCFNLNGLKFTSEAGLPVSIPWTAENNKGEIKIVEALQAFQTVPKDMVKYSAKFKCTAKKQAKISAGGTRKFKVLLNGVEVLTNEGNYYVPAFHRDPPKTIIDLVNGYNNLEIVFEDEKEGELYLAFGTLHGCSEWITTMEWVK